jgi:hypothetical protein
MVNLDARPASTRPICCREWPHPGAQLALDGEHKISQPKRLRNRILHVAGQIARHARTTTRQAAADRTRQAAHLTRQANTRKSRSSPRPARLLASRG